MGLTEEEARRSKERYGVNSFTEKKRTSFFKKLLDSFGDPIIKILLCAFLITVVLPGGGIYETVGIAVTIAVSTFVSTLSEYGSEKAFRKMQEEATMAKCTVLRDGKRKSVYVCDVVVGDAVCVSAGDVIPADGFLIKGGLSCDQAALNGESEECYKSASTTGPAKRDLHDNVSLFRGSTVASGEGVMKVTSVGDLTYYGKMAGEVQTEGGDSPLKKRLSVLAKTLSRFGYFCAALVAASTLISAFLLDKSFVFSAVNVASELIRALTLAVSVVVVAVPEGLPMMITVVLSSNMVRMQKQHVRVRRAVGIETSGNVDILFTDKTGTLTYGAPKAACYVMGDGGSAARASDLAESLRFLLGGCAVYASGCSSEKTSGLGLRRAVGGDGTDRAILDGYLSCGEYPKGLTLLSRLPFDSKRKLMAATVSLEGVPERARALGKTVTFVKGAPELLLPRCTGYYRSDGSVGKINVRNLSEKADKLMASGMRVLALVTSGANGECIEEMSRRASMNQVVDTEALYTDMHLICLVGIRDGLRREAAGAVKTLAGAGIQVVMITGDSKRTAEAIAREAGIIPRSGDGGAVIDSTELSKMSDAELKNALPTLRVVARAMPSDKSRLVRIAKDAGMVTAMTGDGINDAPALKAADVGFAMGSGTEVAKEASDIIITDNNIASVVRAVLYGRTIFRSIRKFIVFQLTMNICAVGISVLGPFIGCEAPVTVIQMLWINMIMDTLAALAFAGEAPMERYMKEPPLPRNEPVLNGDMITRIFVTGTYTVMLCLFFHNSAWIRSVFRASENDIYFLSGFFALFVFCGIFGAFNARSGRINIFSGLFVNPVFITVISAVFTAQLAMIYFGGEVLRCAPLTFSELSIVLLLSFTVIPFGILLEAVMKIGGRERNPIPRARALENGI